MATESLGNTRTMIAGVDLSAQQYRFLRRDAAGQALVALAGGLNHAGILQNAPILGRAATVGTNGRSKVVAGAAITLPANLTSDATGRAVAIAAGTDRILGSAVGGATAAGQIIEIDLDVRNPVGL